MYIFQNLGGKVGHQKASFTFFLIHFTQKFIYFLLNLIFPPNSEKKAYKTLQTYSTSEGKKGNDFSRKYTHLNRWTDEYQIFIKI